MIQLHSFDKDKVIAEILPGSDKINSPEDMLDIMADAGYRGCRGIIIHKETLHKNFFDLKTGLAGEILQKFSNYRMNLAIIGDFSQLKSKSLRDFVRESNKTGTTCFVGSRDEAFFRLNKR